MRTAHITIEKVENGFVIEHDCKTWVAERPYDARQIVENIIIGLDGKDDLEEFEKGVEEFVDAMKGEADGR
jgi:hypothetical protein